MGLILEEIPVDFCPSCKSKKISIDYKHAEIYCKKCGEIISEKLIDRDLKRSLAEKISYSPRGKKLIIKYPSMFQTPEERALKPAHHDLLWMDTMLNIPRYAKAQILKMYLQLYRKGFTFGRNRMAVLGSLLYIISRNNDLFYYLDYISEAVKIDARLIRKFSGKICRELEINLMPPSAENYLIKIGYDLGASARSITLAREILERFKEKKLLTGRSPITKTAVSLYLSSKIFGEDCSLDRIRVKVGVYPDTVRGALRVIDGKIELDNLERLAGLV